MSAAVLYLGSHPDRRGKMGSFIVRYGECMREGPCALCGKIAV